MIFLPCKLETDFLFIFHSSIVMSINILDAFWLIRVEKFNSKEYFSILSSKKLSSEYYTQICIDAVDKEPYVWCTFVVKSDGRKGVMN